MTKRFFIIIMCLLIAATLLGCSDEHTVQSADTGETPQSMFVEVERASCWMVVYHRDTGVMYAVSRGGYNYGTFTLLVDAEGAPLIYGGNYNG